MHFWQILMHQFFTILVLKYVQFFSSFLVLQSILMQSLNELLLVWHKFGGNLKEAK